jgi:dihydrofolate reductase
VMEGGTAFTFVTDGIESAVAQAREAAGAADVVVAGGGDAARQALAAGLLDELQVHLVPILLGSGTPLFGGTTGTLERTRALESPTGVLHLRYRPA